VVTESGWRALTRSAHGSRISLTSPDGRGIYIQPSSARKLTWRDRLMS
jgi:hypothetical protein